MSKAEAIKQFIKKRIAEVDSSQHSDDDLLSKLKSSSMRTSFANVSKQLG
jgi:DNA-directed RNA polymerase specialized sigma54-like protein